MMYHDDKTLFIAVLLSYLGSGVCACLAFAPALRRYSAEFAWLSLGMVFVGALMGAASSSLDGSPRALMEACFNFIVSLRYLPFTALALSLRAPYLPRLLPTLIGLGAAIPLVLCLIEPGTAIFLLIPYLTPAGLALSLAGRCQRLEKTPWRQIIFWIVLTMTPPTALFLFLVAAAGAGDPGAALAYYLFEILWLLIVIPLTFSLSPLFEKAKIRRGE